MVGNARLSRSALSQAQVGTMGSPTPTSPPAQVGTRYFKIFIPSLSICCDIHVVLLCPLGGSIFVEISNMS